MIICQRVNMAVINVNNCNIYSLSLVQKERYKFSLKKSCIFLPVRQFLDYISNLILQIFESRIHFTLNKWKFKLWMLKLEAHISQYGSAGNHFVRGMESPFSHLSCTYLVPYKIDYQFRSLTIPRLVPAVMLLALVVVL